MANSDPTASSPPSGPPSRRPPRNPAYVLAAHAVDAMADKKAEDIVVLDLRPISAMADFFVLGTGGSDVQIRAIANGVEDHVEERCNERPWQREGTDALEWVVLDYVDVVVHVFSADKRAHYDIERLWGDADRAEVPADGDASDVSLLQDLLPTEASKDSSST